MPLAIGTGVMTSLKLPPMERTVRGSVPATDEFYTRHLRLVNGAPVPTRGDSAHTTVSTGVPKMGVRARVADWPPRKDITGTSWHSIADSENSVPALCLHVSPKPPFPGPTPNRRSLQRTLSDESIYSGQRESSSSGQRDTPTDLLFSCSTIPRSPTTRNAQGRRQSHKSMGDLSAPESMEFEQDKKNLQLEDPVLMPLPDAGADGPLDWAHLVDAAKAFEEQRLVFLAAQEESALAESTASSSTPQQAEPQAAPLRLPPPGDINDSPARLLGKVGQLESMVKMLQDDLNKEKDAKASLQMQVQSLREDNQRLLEESYSASTKLKKFTEWVFNTIDMN